MSQKIAHNPCIFRENDFFQVKVCSCGTTHLYFGATTLNLSLGSVRMLNHVLNEVLQNQEVLNQLDSVNASEATFDEQGNVIKGYFHPRSSH